MARVEDDEFKAAAKQAEAEERAKAAERKARAANGGGFTKIKWTAVPQTPGMLILRFLGKHPDLHYGTTVPTITPTDARVINLSRVIADNGKQMDMILPLYERNSNHIMWRIYDRINTVTWVEVKDEKDPTKKKNEKRYINQSKYPEIFNIVNYNNLPETAMERKYILGRGWKGKELLIVNVIDRAIYDWHQANKHSALLAKKITHKSYADGTENEFIEKGVPAYGLSGPLTKLRMVYGDWEQYDIAFERTGQKETPGEAFNASKNPEKVLDETLQALISSEPLTEEEASWEQYDLDKIFGESSYIKLWNRLHLTIEKIDAQLGTFYADELKKLADEEASKKMDFPPKDDEEEPAPEAEPEAEAAPEEPLRRTVKPAVSTVTLEPKDLPGYKVLTDKEKSLIASVGAAPAQGKRDWKIVFTDKASKRTAPCPECETMSSEEFEHCPGCGVTFVF